MIYENIFTTPSRPNCASSHKIDCVHILSEILNLKGHLNRFKGSKVTAILVNGEILPSGGVAQGRVCASSLRSRLVFLTVMKYVHDQLLEMEFYNSLSVNMVQSTFQWLNHIGPRHNKLDKYFFSQEECYIQNIKITNKLFKNILLLICLLYPCEITLGQTNSLTTKFGHYKIFTESAPLGRFSNSHHVCVSRYLHHQRPLIGPEVI